MKYLKWLGIIILTLMLLGVIGICAVSEEEPLGAPGTKADELAQSVLEALNYEAFKELRYIQWTFFGGKHHYKWDKHDNVAEIKWDKNKVVMQLDSKEAIVSQDGKPITELVYKNALINEAWKYWCNDSFWMFAPFKLFDPGTERSVVNLDSGKQALKIHYASGGHTPGDTYLWELNDQNIPVSWKMWTSILPIDGAEFTWEDWQSLEGGAKISVLHSSPVIDMKMKQINSGNSLAELNWPAETFKYK